jgi:hypothetical protein
VIEHERPRRATLQMGSGRLSITYTLEPDGNGVRLQRELDFHPQDFAASVSDGSKVEPLMHAQSEQALHKLKALVERILGEEAI